MCAAYDHDRTSTKRQRTSEPRMTCDWNTIKPTRSAKARLIEFASAAAIRHRTATKREECRHGDETSTRQIAIVTRGHSLGTRPSPPSPIRQPLRLLLLHYRRQLPASKRAKRQKQEDDEIEMPPPQFTITNGVRFVKPYWGAYKTFAKGRWVGHKLVDIFKKEFLGADPNYMIAAVKLGRFIVNGKCANVDHVIGGRDVIVHYRHRHELPVLDAPLEIIADTDDLLVVNKPPSVPVHACGSYNYHTVISLLHLLHGYKRADLRLLHRLDRTTSGVLLFAKNYATDLKFKTTLGDGHWRKEYICMVDGEFPAEEMVCDKKIGVLVSSMGVQCIRDDGKEARTRFRRSWTDGKRSLVRCYPETGRTHQIRVHLQYLGFPIVNDQLYNKDVWGPNKGKNGDYGMPFDELCEGVKKAHRSELWHIDGTLDPKYTERMRRAADEDLEQEPNLPCDQRPEIDIYCRECHLLKKEVPHDHFVMYLHCLKYETDDWSFTAPLPDWAKEAEAGSEQRVLA